MLGHPWFHERGVVASTLNQCLKYYWAAETMINGNFKPFNVVESHFIDAKFFKKDATSKETILAAMSPTGKSSVMNAKETHIPPKDGGDGNIKPT